VNGYIVVNARIVDKELLDEYRNSIGTSIADHGGRIIVATNDAEALEGDPIGTRVIVVEFPSVEAARTWYDSPEYAGPKAIRLRATEGTLLLAEGRV
jgi:uncharacterized protein (DUF1330 family)